jgi:PPM family protein phosphatase
MAQEPTINILLHAQTDIGMVRHGNEDNFLVVDLSSAETWTAERSGDPPKKLLNYPQGHYGSVIAVTDGMGGALAGEVASQMAVNAVRDRMLQFQATPAFSQYPFHERLRLSIEQANLLINIESQNNVEYTGMGATFTAAGLEGDTAYLAQVGDSRCYLVRAGKIAQVTKDQSLVSQLVEAGHITEEEAEAHTYKNVILQALGAQPRVNVIVDRVRLRRNDTFLLCSDGLSGKVKGPEMLKIVIEHPDIKDACNALIKLANERGGEDNITVLIARFDGEGLQDAQAEESLKGEFIPRDPTLPDEIDPAQLNFPGDETLQPEEQVVSAKAASTEHRVESQGVQAAINVPAGSPQMVTAQASPMASMDATSASSGAAPSSMSAPSAPAMSTDHGSSSVSTENDSEEVQEGGKSRAFLFITLIALVALALIIFFIKR